MSIDLNKTTVYQVLLILKKLNSSKERERRIHCWNREIINARKTKEMKYNLEKDDEPIIYSIVHKEIYLRNKTEIIEQKLKKF